MRSTAAVLTALILVSCSSLSYYGQSISGQLEILSKRRPLAQVIADPETDPRQLQQFRQVLEIRDFASRKLGLPDNNSFRSYVRLNRPYVVWNVIATPEFSLDPVQWCFLVVGCLPYRGYFHRAAALQFATRLKAQGYDVQTGGVSAYSTLGWFDDPVLSTMLNRDITDTARIIFHELAHQHTYVKNAADFNEAFADTVAQIGVRLWLTDTGKVQELARFDREQAHEQDFFQLVEEYKTRLNRLYRSGLTSDEKRLRKSAIFKQMIQDYHGLRAHWGSDNAYDDWFDQGLNNARLATVLTYRNLVPAFLSLYETLGRDFPRFYQRVGELAQCPPALRKHYLETGQVPRDCGK